jgi:hypothetical protein
MAYREEYGGRSMRERSMAMGVRASPTGHWAGCWAGCWAGRFSGWTQGLIFGRLQRSLYRSPVVPSLPWTEAATSTATLVPRVLEVALENKDSCHGVVD